MWFLLFFIFSCWVDFVLIWIHCLIHKCDCSKCNCFSCPKFALYDTKFNSLKK